uniref:EF-hand domain-containing protein n=1 Tax=Paramoeba aestuarina TaxID=180227 RepID=A0A7S4L576_9EUKA|mmetsp:Transcript_31605/g.49381  ORF Transcript_31605/g.49381 Transcript_31605/m.49381 type:complete len:221 (+) Transcript_31605:155-817(+)|eukprot:CAMPEP_0201521568 /NCGR_PEP_ID=MMETSP0161_2-20130828/14890_1 /ASSEMBLY_ACC=CAM_ASM_000251 /TAXON_ID=180227 /ORGANISM="Neoparamoeba aestuarina, Strain SoJaBio B1-5/56/2" /LENGTH=220 /DNA_ID=CAMNT_0047920223 /DNA_START=34 /DNA_END=696 /DNA_ORIENTATION=-
MADIDNFQLPPGKTPRSSAHALKAKESVPQYVTSVYDAEAVNKLIDRFFFEMDKDRSGALETEEFKDMLQTIGIQDEKIAEQYFKAWDEDKDGKVDFQEFITGLTTLHGAEDDRLGMAFKVYDLDGNGMIDRDEMSTILKRSLKFSHPELGPAEISTIVLDLFRSAGVDPDDELNLEQFKQGVRSKKIVADCFRPTQSLLGKKQQERRSSVGNALWYKDL